MKPHWFTYLPDVGSSMVFRKWQDTARALDDALAKLEAAKLAFATAEEALVRQARENWTAEEIDAAKEEYRKNK